MSPLLLPFLLLLLSSSTTSSTDLLSELQTLRSQSPSGVIHLTDALITRYLTSSPTPRPYSLLIFFDASQLRSKPDLHLPQLRSEFSLLSSSFHTNNPSISNPIFFADIEFQESQSSFHLFQVSSLPHVRFVSPHTHSLPLSTPMDQSHFSRLADSMSEFLQSQTNIPVGPIHRPPPISPNQLYFLLLTSLLSAPYLIKRVLRGDTIIHDIKLWMSLSVLVYYFSVSGMMHNIIRKMPMALPDRDGKGTVFFYQGSGMQLGAEGFAVGFLYTVVGLMMAFATHVLVRVRSVGVQRGFMAVALVVGYWAVRKVIWLDNWKTGYAIHAFWPSRWK